MYRGLRDYPAQPHQVAPPHDTQTYREVKTRGRPIYPVLDFSFAGFQDDLEYAIDFEFAKMDQVFWDRDEKKWKEREGKIRCILRLSKTYCQRLALARPKLIDLECFGLAEALQ